MPLSPIHERFNIIFAIEDPLGSIQRLACRNPLEEIVTFPLPLLRGLQYSIPVAGLRYFFLRYLPPPFLQTCHRCNFFDIPCIRMLFNLIAALKINFNARLHRITCSLAAPCCTNFSTVCARAHPDMLHGHRELPLTFNFLSFVMEEWFVFTYWRNFFVFCLFFSFCFVFRVSRLKWMGNGAQNLFLGLIQINRESFRVYKNFFL